MKIYMNTTDRPNKLMDIVDGYCEDCENDIKRAGFKDDDEKQKLVGKKFVKCSFCGSIVTENSWFNKDNEHSRKYHNSIYLWRFAYIPEYNTFAQRATCSECLPGFDDCFYICIDTDGNDFILHSNEVDRNDIFWLAKIDNNHKPPYIFFRDDFDKHWQEAVRKSKNK